MKGIKKCTHRYGKTGEGVLDGFSFIQLNCYDCNEIFIIPVEKINEYKLEGKHHNTYKNATRS